MENLVAFEYGTGRIWGYITGATPQEIVARLPELDVYDESPAWMTDADIEGLRRHATWELNGSASTLLDKIIASRIVAEAALVD
jgi:hypothetical protein